MATDYDNDYDKMTLDELMAELAADRGEPLAAIGAAWRLLEDGERAAAERVEHLRLLHTIPCGGIGQTQEERRRADEAAAALPPRVKALADAARKVWVSAVTNSWLWARALADDAGADAPDDVEGVMGDSWEDGLAECQTLAALSSDADPASLVCELHYILEVKP